jgi:hypothetical protein
MFIVSCVFFKVNAMALQIEEQIKEGKSEFEAKTAVGIESEVSILRHRVQVLGGRLRGSDLERVHMRREVWSLCYKFGFPTLFVTMNFAETNAAMVVYFSGGFNIELSLGKQLLVLVGVDHACKLRTVPRVRVGRFS